MWDMELLLILGAMHMFVAQPPPPSLAWSLPVHFKQHIMEALVLGVMHLWLRLTELAQI